MKVEFFVPNRFEPKLWGRACVDLLSTHTEFGHVTVVRSGDPEVGQNEVALPRFAWVCERA